MIIHMYSYKSKSLLGTLLFSGLFLGICYFVIRYLPADSSENQFTESNNSIMSLNKENNNFNSTTLISLEKSFNKAIENPSQIFVSKTKNPSTEFSTYSLSQNALSAVTLAENLNLSGEDLLTSAGFELAFENDESKKFKTSLNEDFSSAEDSCLTLYRQPQSRPAVEWFFTHITNNREIARAILENADKNDIAPSLAFALAYVESRYKITAINKNANQSTDRGLFQLNDKTFPKLTENDFFNPKVSAKYGISHLRYCMDIAGNEITALAMYNAGTTRVKNNNTPQQTLNYVAKITKYRKSLDNQFTNEVLAFYDSSAKENAIALAN